MKNNCTIAKIASIMLFIVSCNKPRYQIVEKFVCNDNQKKDAAEYCIKCIEFAGMGGESEPEDWLDKCERISLKFHCKIEEVKECYIHCDN